MRVVFCLKRAKKMKAVFSLGIRISFSKQYGLGERNRLQMLKRLLLLSIWAVNFAGRARPLLL